MEPWIIYAIVALGISLTSYLNIYKPALDLYLEITEDEESIIASILYKIIWVILGFILAPLVAYMLARGRNDNYIKDLVVTWIDNSDDE